MLHVVAVRCYPYATRITKPEIRIRSSEKFLSFYKEIMDVQHFPFYIILSNYARSILFYQNEDHNVRQIRFHVCINKNAVVKDCINKNVVVKDVSVKERHFSDNLIYYDQTSG